MTSKRSFTIIECERTFTSLYSKGGDHTSDTKEQILLTALRLFAANGYEAVSVSDIAGALGMTKGALYRHYQNKRDIFDSILSRMEQRDAAQANDHDLPEGTKTEMEDAYQNASLDDVIDFSKSMFRYWTQDGFASSFRKMLTLEQYRSPEMGRLYQQYLAAGPLDYLTDLFAGMGLPHPREKAVKLYGPMFLLYSVYDGAEEKEKALSLLDEIMEQTRIELAEERK